MKIGILTFHRAHNYGAVLQCYALQEVLKSMGHNVQVIDYRHPYTEYTYKVFSLCKIISFFNYKHPLGFLKNILRYFKAIKKRKERRLIYNSFVKKNLNTTNPCDDENIPQNMDLYIIGSDQLWGMICIAGKYKDGLEDKVYMGNFRRGAHSRLIGYAISSNVKSIETIKKESLINYVNKFNAISFREEEISKLVEEKTGVKTRTDIDPTLLTEKTTWQHLLNDNWKKRKYLLFYQVRVPKGDVLRINAKELAKQEKLEFVDLSNMTYSVEDFVSAFAYAKCVITSSFHATVFSLIFERQFYSVQLYDGHDGRYVNLLKLLGAEDALSDINIKNHSLKKLNLNYSLINNNLATLRNKSLYYLSANTKSFKSQEKML